MRKLCMGLLACLLCVTMTACTDAPIKEENGQPQTATKTTATKNSTWGLNDTAAFKNLKFTATEIKESDGESLFTPEDGNVFVGVCFTVENISDEEQAVSSILLFEAYVDDIKCDYSFSATCAFGSDSLDGSIAPGKKMVGWYAVEVPATWSELELDVQADLLSSKSAKFVFTK